MIQVDNENPIHHWQFVEVENRVVLDLGCGRYEKYVYRNPDWPTTPEYFVQKGAKHVNAIDIDHGEIEWFRSEFKNESDKCTFIEKEINSVESFENIILTYKPDCVKCDIEGAETYLFDLHNNIFSLVKEYYIETHGNELYEKCINKLNESDYEIFNQIDLTHTGGFCKVIFARKK
jgi:hypothetical protein